VSNCEKEAKNGKKNLLAFFSKNREEKNRRRDKTLINSQQSSLHTKKKEKNSNHRHSSHHGTEFFLLEQRLVHEDIRADTSQRSRCVRYTLRALSLSFYFSLSRPRRTAGIIVDAFRRRDYTSLTDKLFFSLSLCITIIKITDAWRFPI